MQPNENNPGQINIGRGFFCCIGAGNRYDSLKSMTIRELNNRRK
jgi:hypothetical protein